MMSCPKCNGKMVCGKVETNISIHGDEITPPYPRAPYQKSYAPVYAYICENCGYIELYTQSSKADTIR